MTELQHPISDAARSTHCVGTPLPSGLIHDLRTPLNQIIGYSEMLMEQAQEAGHDRFVPDLQKVRAAGQQLLALINDNFHPIRTSDTPAAIAAPREGHTTPIEQEPTAEGFSEHPAAGEPASGASHEFLLVVDDIEANRDLLSRRLKRQGYAVAAAENGRQALEMLRAGSFDLVLLDIMMPEIDGYEVLQRLKADDRLQHIPVIMISALSELDSVVRCIEMGAEDYLPKPFNPTLLKARIGACLEKKRLWDQLRQNYDRLQALERLRDDLTHMIVHDLRTPLTSIIGGLQMTLHGRIDPHSPEGEEMGAMALSGAHSLLGMINDLLDVGKIEAGQMVLDRSRMDLTAAARAAVDQVRALAREKRIRLMEDLPSDLETVVADEEKMRRVLVNLLGNALKFTPEDGEVTLKARRQGNAVRVSVRDTGEGIPVEYRERIFEKFGQVESRRGGRMMSTGLGLTFCKLAVEAHGGTIGVVSVLGQGSTFWFSLPLTADPKVCSESRTSK